MSTKFKTLRNNLIYELHDVAQSDYIDAELLVYGNKAVSYLSRKLAAMDARIAESATSVTYGTGTVSKNLPDGFIKFAANQYGTPRVFNLTNGTVAMSKADDADIDDWESETSADKGTPTTFYIRGNKLYVHPRGDKKYDIKYYHYTKQTVSSTGGYVPWDGQFDEAIESFIISKCRNRSENVGAAQNDGAEFSELDRAAFETVFGRDGFEIGFSDGFNWGD